MRAKRLRGRYPVHERGIAMVFPDYESYDATGLAGLVRSGEVTPKELVDAAIDRIERRNGAVHAVIHRRFDAARIEAGGRLADGPFRGVPFLLKDLTSELAGTPMNAGSRLLASYVPDHDSELVRRYRAAGVVIVGKTNTPEFGITPTTEPRFHGPTRNPWDPTRSSGGSSGGSAAAVATGMVPAAHGGDGGGSIRIPSSCCGLFGMKPTRGRTPTGPHRGPMWHGASVEHVLTRSVRDSAAFLDATAGPDAGAPYWAPPNDRPFLDEVSRDPGRLRIAFTTRPFLSERVAPECVAAVEDTVRLLEELGHEVVEAHPDLDGEAFVQSFITMIAGEVRADVEEAARIAGRDPAWSDLEPSTWSLFLLGRAFTAADLSLALRRLSRETRRVGLFFRDWDVLLTPTLGSPPLPLGTLKPTTTEAGMARALRSLRAGWALRGPDIIHRLADPTFAFIPFTPVFNATGQPAMSVPLHWTGGGLPIGSHFVGRFGDEATLFRLAGQLEQARPWFDRRPDLHAPSA